MSDITNKMNKSIENLKKQFNSMRTNRANPEMLSDIQVEYYGAMTPLNQVATITVPENMALMLSIFDANAVKEVERAILASPLGLTPNVEGNVILIRLPELTEERRLDLVKHIRKQAEEAKVAVRNIRRDEIDQIKHQEKEKEISEDDSKKEQSHVQTVTDSINKQIDELADQKEKGLLTI